MLHLQAAASCNTSCVVFCSSLTLNLNGGGPVFFYRSASGTSDFRLWVKRVDSFRILTWPSAGAPSGPDPSSCWRLRGKPAAGSLRTNGTGWSDVLSATIQDPAPLLTFPAVELSELCKPHVVADPHAHFAERCRSSRRHQDQNKSLCTPQDQYEESLTVPHLCQTWTGCCRGSASQTPGSGFSLERRCRTDESLRETHKEFNRKGLCEASQCRWCRHTFLCLRIISPSGLNTAQLLYNFPQSSSGMDPVGQRGSLIHKKL